MPLNPDPEQAAQHVRADLTAYDMSILPRDHDQFTSKGWVFGLPPGISQSQWPLDPVSGYPLMHGFTLYLPEDYRVHGPDLVAISFFATAFDQNDGGAQPQQDLEAAVLGLPPQANDREGLQQFRDHARQSHPHLHRMTDILGYAYAVIVLTEQEFRSQWCRPPALNAAQILDPMTRPKWLDQGAGYALAGDSGTAVPAPFVVKAIGGPPQRGHDWHRAIEWTPRAFDPNAGIPPTEVFGEPSELGYQSRFDRNRDYALQDWAAAHKRDHIGGTMAPVQGEPSFSPFYLEFEEYFGGYNFGGGNAQLDILQMRFDWACG